MISGSTLLAFPWVRHSVLALSRYPTIFFWNNFISEHVYYWDLCLAKDSFRLVIHSSGKIQNTVILIKCHIWIFCQFLTNREFICHKLLIKKKHNWSRKNSLSKEMFQSWNGQAVLEKILKYWARPLLEIFYGHGLPFNHVFAAIFLRNNGMIWYFQRNNDLTRPIVLDFKSEKKSFFLGASLWE